MICPRYFPPPGRCEALTTAMWCVSVDGGRPIPLVRLHSWRCKGPDAGAIEAPAKVSYMRITIPDRGRTHPMAIDSRSPLGSDLNASRHSCRRWMRPFATRMVIATVLLREARSFASVRLALTIYEYTHTYHLAGERSRDSAEGCVREREREENAEVLLMTSYPSRCLSGTLVV